MFQLLTRTDIPFMRHRRFAYMFSGAVVLATVVWLVIHRGPHYSVDFTGGTLLQIRLSQALPADQVRQALDAGGFRGAELQQMAGENSNEFMVRVGAGQDTKAVNQVLIAGIAQAVCEGLALGAALGLEAEKLLPTLASGAAASWFLDKRGATMLRDEFAVGFKLALLLKDLRIVDGLARGAGTRRDVIERSLADYAELVARGHGDDDISALIRLKRHA